MNKIEMVSSPRAETRFAILALIPFVTLAAFGMFFHELWRDEYHIWVLAMDSPGISDLYRNAGTEGHPLLWYLITWIVTKLFDDPVAFQALHLCIAATTAFLLFRFSPWPRVHRIVAGFGYYLAYEYTVITRSYALSILLIVILAILFTGKTGFSWQKAIMIFLLANTSFYGLLFACLLLAWWMMEPPKAGKNRLLPAAVAGAGILMAYAELYRQVINANILNIINVNPQLTGLERFADHFGIFTEAFLPVPDFRSPHSWNTNIISDSSPWVAALVSLAIVSFTAWNLYRLGDGNAKPFYFFCAGVFLMAGFSMLVFRGWERHQGHMFILFLFCVWLTAENENASAKKSANYRWFLLILFLQLPGAIVMYAKDISNPFSHASALGILLKEPEFDDVLIAGSCDYTLTGVAAASGRKIYYPESRTFASFPRWDQNSREELLSDLPVVQRAYELFNATGRDVIFIISKPVFSKITQQNVGPYNRFHPGTFEMDLRFRQEYSGAIVEDENYYVYRLTHQTANSLPMPTQPGTIVPIRANPPRERRDVKFDLEGFAINRKLVRLEGWAWAPDLDSSGVERTIAFSDGKKTFIQPFRATLRQDVADSLKDAKAKFSGFALDIYPTALPPAVYKLGFYFWDKTGKVAFELSDYSYQVPEPSMKLPFGGMYALMHFPFETAISSSTGAWKEEFLFSLGIRGDQDGDFNLEGFAYPTGEFDPFYSVIVILKSETKTYMAGVNRFPDPKVTENFKLHSSILPIFTSRISKSTLAPGSYSLGLAIITTSGDVYEWYPPEPLTMDSN